MATLREIIKNAYRESGIIQIGTVPTAEQQQEGLEKLTTIIDNTFENEVGADFTDISFGTNGVTNVFGREQTREAFITASFVRPNYRVLFNIDSAKTVYLDPNPKDGSLFAVIDVSGNFSSNNVTVKGNGRKIEGANEIVLDTDNTNKKWMYRADLADWVLCTDLTVDSQTPFPSMFDDLFEIKLAMRLHPRYLVDTRSETAIFYKELMKKFKARYTTFEEMPSELALYRTTRYRYIDYHVDNDSIRFNQGLIY